MFLTKQETVVLRYKSYHIQELQQELNRLGEAGFFYASSHLDSAGFLYVFLTKTYTEMTHD